MIYDPRNFRNAMFNRAGLHTGCYFKIVLYIYRFPCSGLDSTSSLMVVDALKAVAEERKLTIVCVIHQPRYEIFSEYF